MQEWTRTDGDNEVVYSVTGSLSGSHDSAPRFFSQVSVEIQTLKRNITLNFNKVQFMDSMAIGLLVGIVIKVKRHNLKVRLINLQPLVRDILDASNLLKMCPELY